MYTLSGFTVQDAIEIQTKQLLRWKSVLKPGLFKRLVALVTADNDKAETGDNILRGMEIDTLVHNRLMFTPSSDPELSETSHAEWMGFRIERKRDFGKDSTEVGYIVTDKGGICNVMPGATWFHDLTQAHKAIAAFKIAHAIKPGKEVLDGIPHVDGDLFWMLWELTK